ncbi:hypothetical protein AAG747_25370 [Rapidithrix thailandica]|uniref:DUF3592 domain-containing protein n=1 Tax=Rapidithrix thailandica TaxID=413964 RepID=A0AAW9SBH5_9BACT
MKEVKEILVKKIKQSLQPKSLLKTCKLLLFYGTLIGLSAYFFPYPKEPFSHTESLYIFNADPALAKEYGSTKSTTLLLAFFFILCLYFIFFLIFAKRRKRAYITDTFSVFHVIMILVGGFVLFFKARQYFNLVAIDTYYEVERTVISKKQTFDSHNGGGFRGAGGGIETDHDIVYPTTHSTDGYERITLSKKTWEKLEEGDSLLIYYYRGHFNGVTQVTLKKD